MIFLTKNPNLKIFFFFCGGGGGGGWGGGREGVGGRVDGRTEEQAQTNLPFQLL